MPGMIPTVGPRQNRHFDPFQDLLPPAGRKLIGDGWQGLFRHVLLQVMPADERADHFSDGLGAPTKELDAMAGLVFLADDCGWNAQEAAEAYIFRTDAQYALNLEPGVESTHSGLKNRLGLGRLPVRGRGSVFHLLWHKVAGWNVPRAAASERLRARVRVQVAETGPGGGSGPKNGCGMRRIRLWAGWPLDFWGPHGDFQGLGAWHAA